MLGEVVGRDEGENVRLQACQIFVVEDLDGRILDRPIHALGLPIGPGMVGLGQTMLDAVLDANAIEDVRSEELSARSSPVLKQVGECHAVIGQDRMNLVRECGHDVPEEG